MFFKRGQCEEENHDDEEDSIVVDDWIMDLWGDSLR